MNKIWVIKIGSSSIANNNNDLKENIIINLAEQIVMLKQNNIDVILVSSGAIATGLHKLQIKTRPTNIHQLQALSSVGQMDLIYIYQQIFAQQNIITAQILLTNDNLQNQDRYQNIFASITQLLDWNIVPIINENDTVATDEIKFGDNDNLAALLCNLIKAQKLIIITDQKGLFDNDPRNDPQAKLINKISVNDAKLERFAKKTTGDLGTGGMHSKIIAAKQAATSKTITHIVSGSDNQALNKIYNQQVTGTVFE